MEQSSTSTPAEGSMATPLFSTSCRVFHSARKSDMKIFVLRSISRLDLSSIDRLRNKIVNQLGPGIVPADQPFDVGYMRGTTKVCIHSDEDLVEVWRNIEKGSCELWCDGAVEATRANKRSMPLPSALRCSSDSDDDSYAAERKKKKKKKGTSALKEKNARIETHIEELKKKHQDKFTSIQYRLWAEMLDVGTHKSFDDAPCAPMFTRVKQGKPAQSPLTEAFTEMASSIASVFSKQNTSPNPTTPTKTTSSMPSSSPYKVAELRSKYIQQLRELHSLLEAGALTDSEYVEEKELILQQLKVSKNQFNS